MIFNKNAEQNVFLSINEGARFICLATRNHSLTKWWW